MLIILDANRRIGVIENLRLLREVGSLLRGSLLLSVFKGHKYQLSSVRATVYRPLGTELIDLLLIVYKQFVPEGPVNLDIQTFLADSRQLPARSQLVYSSGTARIALWARR